MFFKLFSDGRQTVVEMDGKRLGSAVTGVSFTHDGNDVTAHIDFDLTKGLYERPCFIDAEPGDFADMIKQREISEGANIE